jgi:hypothetical protein
LHRIPRIVALVAAVVLITSLYIRVEQWRFRHRTEQLLADVRALELGKATADDARRVAHRWGFGDTAPKGKCDDSLCEYSLQLQSPMASIPDYFRASRAGENVPLERAVERVLIALGGRPVWVRSFIGVCNGEVHLKGLTLWMATPGPNAQGFVAGSAGTTGRWALDGINRDRPGKILAGSLRHEEYLLGTYTAITNLDYGTKQFVPSIWIRFSPNAAAKTVNRLMRLNFSCITRLRSCGPADMMPEVWNEIARDEQSPSPNLACSSDLVRRVARIADTIAIVRVDSPELDRPYPSGSFRMSDVSMLKLIRGPEYFRFGWVQLEDPKLAIPVDDGTKLQAAGQYIFLLHDQSVSIPVVALYPCGILTLNDANLQMVQEIAEKALK